MPVKKSPNPATLHRMVRQNLLSAAQSEQHRLTLCSVLNCEQNNIFHTNCPMLKDRHGFRYLIPQNIHGYY